jgi:hypothetical protein
LTAEEFNSQLGNKSSDTPTQLKFMPEPSQENLFSKKLFATASANIDAKKLGYLNIKVDEDKSGYIANSNRGKGEANNEKYNNVDGIEYLNLVLRSSLGNDVAPNGYNHSYRFVYFPTEDSLVINAYHVRHDKHKEFQDMAFTDDGKYNFDDDSWGLYNNNIFRALIVQLQDINGIDGATSLMTIDKSFKNNVRMYFGRNGCNTVEDESWQVPKGVYTIWDTEGRCLGVRIYNGSFSPQWIDLEEGECPDRIPSYQWVIEPSDTYSKRINIRNREFGDLPRNGFVHMDNVLVHRGEPDKIFSNHKAQFLYDPIISDLMENHQYQPIVNSAVAGVLLSPKSPMECSIKEASGFRPVTNEFSSDKHLGYKFFHVDSDPTSQGYGKSEDIGDARGMDYNAYTFNYLYYDTEQGHIDTQSEYSDTILHISKTGKTGFQFQLGTKIRIPEVRNNAYKPEKFGYPDREQLVNIKGELKAGDAFENYTQRISILERYYYELKVADFYNYRDGLEDEYVALKGSKGPDYPNKLKYGLVDVSGEKDPYKLANVYLRESYFLPREKDRSRIEERHPADSTRRIYYALLDRVERAQFDRLSDDGLEVSAVVQNRDGTSDYGLVTFKVEEAYPSFLRAQGKTVSSARVSAFALENFNYPLYRRLNSIEHDGADPNALDAPKNLRIYRYANPNHFLHEDALSREAYGYGINFLGWSNSIENPEEYAPDGLVKYNYNLFIDTAYVNRGTGRIKPQYLIAVDPHIEPGRTLDPAEIDDYVAPETQPCEVDPNKPVVIAPYVKARYLINATDSGRMLGSDGTSSATERDRRYIYSDNDRLAFVDAIHVDDRLYIIGNLAANNISESAYTVKTIDGKEYVWGDKLKELTGGNDRKPGVATAYGMYYDFDKWNNYHNDVCFSLRFVHPKAKNPNEYGLDDSADENNNRFLIESETTDRTLAGSRKIAPVQGGWIKLEKFIPVLSRSSYSDAISNAEIFNVAKATAWQGGAATANETLEGKFTVIGGINEVIILNAAGKNVSILNMLGQSLVNKELKSNNENIGIAAKGIVIVNVEGEKAIKAIVK